MLSQPGQSNRLTVSSRRSDIESYEPAAAQSAPKSGPNLLVMAWRRRWIILSCMILGLGCGLLYVWKAVPVYASSSVIYLQTSMPKVLSDEFGNVGTSADYLYTQCQLIQSTTILAGAMDIPGVADADCLKGVENPIGFLKSRVVATPSRQGDFIVVSMESPTVQGAAVIVNAVVQAYIDYQTRMHQSTAVEIVGILQKNVDLHEADLKKAQNAMLNLQRENPDFVFSANADSGTNRTAIGQLSDDLSNAEVRVLDLKMAVAAMTAAQHDPSEMRRIIAEYKLSDMMAGMDNSAEIASLYQNARSALDTLYLHDGPKNPDVQAQQRMVDRLRNELNDANKQATTAAMTAVQQSLAMAQQRVQQLQEAIKAERQSMVSMTSKEIEYEQFAQEAQRAERALDLLDTRMKEINPSEDVGSMTVTILESAKPNPIPVRPNRVQGLGMSVIAGLVVGLGLGFVREMLDQRIRTAEEASASLNLPVLGMVPHIDKVDEKTAPPGLETAVRPRSDVAEAFRTIRTALYFGAHESRLAKTVLVTSPSIADGKSTATSNLAIAVAQAGRRVLLIDADCRRPSQDKIFKLKEGPGLSSVLAGASEFEKAVHKSVFTRLDVLPCGPLPAHPAELLDSQAFVDLLKTQSAEYDHIFIDSPPVIPVSDPRIVAAFCSATILVLRAQRSTRRMAEHACQILDSVGATLLGIIMNDVPRRQRGYHYPYGRYLSYLDENNAANGNAAGSSPAVVTVAGELVDDD